MQFFGVKYDAFSNYLVYPVRDINGNIVNIGGRTLDPNYKEKKMRKYTYFKKWGGQMNVVYGLFENMESIRLKNEVILFEGMKSVMIARGFGYKNCGAILTSHLNSAQMRILAKLGVRVVFALDKEIVTISARALYFQFVKLMREHGYDNVRFHDLRHIAASDMNRLGIPDKVAAERGGWATTYTMRAVYQHAFSADREMADDLINEYYTNLFSGESHSQITEYDSKDDAHF